jgi:hypothetical protein
MNDPTPREVLRQEIKQLIEEGQQLITEQNQRVAAILVETGFHLSDYTVMVSPRVYEAVLQANKLKNQN